MQRSTFLACLEDRLHRECHRTLTIQSSAASQESKWHMKTRSSLSDSRAAGEQHTLVAIVAGVTVNAIANAGVLTNTVAGTIVGALLCRWLRYWIGRSGFVVS